MFDVAPLFKIAPIFAVALASPGPAFMLISSLALSRGRAAGVKASFGIALSDSIYVVLCLFGLGIVFAKMQGLMIVVRLLGGAYLLYLGYQLWKASFQPHVEVAQAPAVKTGKQRNPFVIGFLTNMTNPKAMAFYTSIFALILPKDASFATEGGIIVVIGTMSVLWFSWVSFCLSTPAMRKVYLRWSRWIDRVCGTFLAFFGVRLLSSFRN